MRKLMALVVLLCGAASAYAEHPHKWCSENGKFTIEQITSSEYRYSDKRPVAEDAKIIWKNDVSGWVYKGNTYWPCSSASRPPELAEPQEQIVRTEPLPPEPGVFMRDAMLNAPADASFGTAWCSNGFDKPAVLSQNGHELLLTVGGTTEVMDVESAETRKATLMASSGMENYPRQDVWIVRDRVFWPCEKAYDPLSSIYVWDESAGEPYTGLPGCDPTGVYCE